MLRRMEGDGDQKLTTGCTNTEITGDPDKISTAGNIFMGLDVGKNGRLCCKAKLKRQELVADVASR